MACGSSERSLKNSFHFKENLENSVQYGFRGHHGLLGALQLFYFGSFTRINSVDGSYYCEVLEVVKQSAHYSATR